MSDESFLNSNMVPIPYAAVRQAMRGKPYTASLVGADAAVVIEAVNAGIDSHLEACFVPDRGDRFEAGERRIGETVVARTIECTISPESLPVLLRRLSEAGTDEADSLVDAVLTTLGFDDSGRHDPEHDAPGLWVDGERIMGGDDE
jgi:hypothetical protein